MLLFLHQPMQRPPCSVLTFLHPLLVSLIVLLLLVKNWPGGGGGNGSKRFLFSLLHSQNNLCLGSVGASKFCTKACVSGTTACQVLSHGGRKFEINSSAFYVKESEARALCSPALGLGSAAFLSDDQITRVLQHSASVGEWELIFFQTSTLGIFRHGSLHKIRSMTRKIWF